MSHDTSKQNQSRQNLSNYHEIWLFGYGSLIYKVDFPFLDKQKAVINGWQRKFWQGSHDHRGTPERPGRVLTLIESPGSECMGMAYRVTEEVFEHLNIREKNGYLRHEIECRLLDSHNQITKIVKGLIYIASPENAAYLGPLPESDIAEHIARSEGPSGKNSEYLLLLAEALRNLGAHDEHVFTIENHLNDIIDR
ncbi:gamma-glutamylcyclotransferase [Pleionea sediminis]|uniref:gamma-glutamylcyclotransferase n=1 Tax=Pleionea sediminis TaxID=2569479 RepID=UPI00118609D8|nr:gamma-glutamylcyclotransferase [Pleionea sediminis]